MHRGDSRKQPAPTLNAPFYRAERPPPAAPDKPRQPSGPAEPAKPADDNETYRLIRVSPGGSYTEASLASVSAPSISPKSRSATS